MRPIPWEEERSAHRGKALNAFLKPVPFEKLSPRVRQPPDPPGPGNGAGAGVVRGVGCTGGGAVAPAAGGRPFRIPYLVAAAAFFATEVTSLVAFFTAAVASSDTSLPAASSSSTVSICTFFATSAKAARFSAASSAEAEA